ncbi:hypothetical protein JCM8547_006011 [Rhodosporidiobolus lusitaniae]
MSTLDSFLDLSALRADLPDVYSSLKPSPDFTSLLPPELKLKIIEELANELHEQSIKAYDDPHALETRCAPLDFSEAATFARADVKVASVLLAARSLRDNTGERLFSEAEAAFLAEELLLDDCYYNKLGNYTIRLVARYKSKIYPPGVKVSLNPSGHEAFDRKVRLLGKELQRNEGCALALQCTHHLHFTEARFSNLRHSAAHLTVHNAEIKKHYSLTNLQLGGPVSVALKMTALALQAHEETIPNPNSSQSGRSKRS